MVLDPVIVAFRLGVVEFGRRLQNVGPTDWDRRTPASRWTVRDLVAHVVEELRWAVPLVEGLELDDAEEIAAAFHDRDRLPEAWAEASGAALDAINKCGELENRVALVFGPASAREYTCELVLDLAVHSWDLGRALGQSVTLPDELIGAAWQHVLRIGDLTATGLFLPPVPVPDDASATDKLVAVTGRSPGWTP